MTLMILLNLIKDKIIQLIKNPYVILIFIFIIVIIISIFIYKYQSNTINKLQYEIKELKETINYNERLQTQISNELNRLLVYSNTIDKLNHFSNSLQLDSYRQDLWDSILNSYNEVNK